jgi:hypothetical protein
MNDAIATLLVWFSIAVFVVVLGFVANRARTKGIAENAAEKQKKIKDGLASGTTDEHGNPICIVCHTQLATCPGVITGRTWGDGWLDWLKRLYAVPPRFKVVDAPSDRRIYCQLCYQTAQIIMEQLLARLRSKLTQFNSGQLQEITAYEQGGLESAVRKWREETEQRIALFSTIQRTAEPPRLLESVPASVTYTSESKDDS